MEAPQRGSRWHASGGKLILLGEHAVVYGQPAIVLGGTKGARARASLSRDCRLRLGGEQFTVPARPTGAEAPVVAAFRASLVAAEVQSADCEVQLDVPPGVGLGASAAIAVATARALLALTSPLRSADEEQAQRDSEQVLTVANAWESVFHGNASGVDTAAAMTPGLLWFARGLGAVRLESCGTPMAVVAVADAPASTRQMVEMVAARRRVQPLVVDQCLEHMGALAHRARCAARTGNWLAIGELMNANHRLLQELNLSTAALDTACESARKAGALGAKLTGAGGGGCAVALCDETSTLPVLEAWRRAGYRAFAFE